MRAEVGRAVRRERARAGPADADSKGRRRDARRTNGRNGNGCAACSATEELVAGSAGLDRAPAGATARAQTPKPATTGQMTRSTSSKAASMCIRRFIGLRNRCQERPLRLVCQVTQAARVGGSRSAHVRSPAASRHLELRSRPGRRSRRRIRGCSHPRAIRRGQWATMPGTRAHSRCTNRTAGGIDHTGGTNAGHGTSYASIKATPPGPEAP